MTNYPRNCFKAKRHFTIDEIAKKLGKSKRTIKERWKKKGLLFKNGKVIGKDINQFLLDQRNNRKFKGNYVDNLVCFHTKQYVNKIVNPKFLKITYSSKAKRFQIISKCLGDKCSNKNCNRQIGPNFKLQRYLSKQVVLNLYGRQRYRQIGIFTNEAIQQLETILEVERKEETNEKE